MASSGRTPSPTTVSANHLNNNSNHHPLERRRVSDIQRTRMLTAMFDVVAELGVAKVSVAHVVARSGVSRRTFYELFKDREDCFLAAFDEAVRTGEELVLRACEAAAPRWRERVRAGLEALLRFMQDEPAMGRLLVVEALAAGPKALERRGQVLARLVEAIDRGRAEGGRSGTPPPLTAEGVVGAIFSVVHGRMLEPKPGPLTELAGPLMSMAVLPYLGPSAARRELDRPLRALPALPADGRKQAAHDPLRGLDMRLTYRTVRVLLAIAAHPRASNRRIAEAAEVTDQGQMSKLLARLHHLGLIENVGSGASVRGEPNAWTLTARGQAVEQTIHAQQ